MSQDESPLEQPWSYLHINGITVALEDRGGTLVWECSHYVYPRTATGRRRPNAVGHIEVAYSSPWMRDAVAWAVAYTQGENTPGTGERDAIFYRLKGEQQPHQ